MNLKRLTISTVIAAASVAASPAYADRGARDERSSAGFSVSREQAEATARAEGLETVWEVEARRGVWKLEGADANGRKIEISIDGQTGEVVKREVYGSSNASSNRS